LEVEKEDKEGNEEEEGNAKEKERKEIVNIYDEDEILPIGVLLKKDIVETIIQNNV
jgi:hypothetical protein